jgi:ribonuclease P protein component
VKRAQRLRTPAEFRRVRELARRGIPHPLLVLYCAPNEGGPTRVGITVSRRVGNAVVRNRVRRRLREALRIRYAQLPASTDVVISARPASAKASWAELNVALDAVLTQSS